MNCEEAEELAGVYALGALPAEEHADVRSHLESCANHPDAAELLVVSASLALAAPEGEPSPALKSRLMNAIREEVQPKARAAPEGGLLGWLRRLKPQTALSVGLAGALAVAVVALIVTNTGGSDDAQTAVATLTGAGSAQASVYELDNGVVVMQAEGLQPLTEDQTYQVWGINERGPASLGLLGPAPEGEAIGAIGADLSSVDTLAVTVEPAGGSAAPTSDPIMAGETGNES
jgi:anti-sigma-K factor RskA